MLMAHYSCSGAGRATFFIVCAVVANPAWSYCSSMLEQRRNCVSGSRGPLQYLLSCREP